MSDVDAARKLIADWTAYRDMAAKILVDSLGVDFAHESCDRSIAGTTIYGGQDGDIEHTEMASTWYVRTVTAESTLISRHH